MSANVGCGPCRGCGRLMSHLNQMDKLHTVILGHFQGEHQQKPVKNVKPVGPEVQEAAGPLQVLLRSS